MNIHVANTFQLTHYVCKFGFTYILFSVEFVSSLGQEECIALSKKVILSVQHV